ncbi:hypothetical protein DFJ73DRAFT_269655 [Zopfochytrium polystomum]|nr:hypothetical protein DFJ73DRAFT_269655 [Zopfochytrium polystomum]
MRKNQIERARLLEEASLSTGYEELTMGQFHQAYDRCFDILRRLQDSEESLLKERHAKEISDFEHGPERAWSHICWEGTFNEALRSGVVGRLSHVTMYTEHMFQIPLGEAIQTKGLSPDWDRMLPQLNRERCRFGLLAVSKSEPKDSFDNMHRLLRQAHDSNKFVWLERVTLEAGLLSIYLIPMSKVIVPKAQTARNPSLREAVGRPGHTFLVAMILAGDSGDPVAALGPPRNAKPIRNQSAAVGFLGRNLRVRTEESCRRKSESRIHETV